jgi:hypothetical protein
MSRITAVTHTDLHANHPDILVDFASMCARLSKLPNSSQEERLALRDHVSTVTLMLDLASLTGQQLARLLWASATVSVKPIIPASFAHEFLVHALSEKDLCNALWGLSKFASSSEPEILTLFSRMIDALDDARLEKFSNEDLVAILRSASNVYSR